MTVTVAGGLRSLRLPLAGVTVAVTSAMADVVWLSVLATLVCLASAVSGATFVRRLVIALPGFVGLSSVVFTTLAVVGLATDVRWVVVAVALASFVIAALLPPEPVPWADGVDGWAAVATCLAVALVARSAVTWHAADMLARLARHTDGIRHIALGAAVERHGGYVTFVADPHRLPGLQHYPQGGAGLMAIVLRTVGGHRPVIATVTVIGFWVLVGALGVLAWVFTTLALLLARTSGERTRRLHGLGAVLVAIATVAVGPHFLVYEPGYFTQDIATIALLAVLCVVVEPASQLRVVVTLALLVVAIAQAWYLLLPVALVVVVRWWWQRSSRGLIVVPAVVVAPFVLFPLLTGPSPTKQLLAIGGTPAPNRFIVAALIVGGGAAAVMLRSRRSGARVDSVFMLSFATLAALMVAVAGIELAMATTQSAYYAIKLFVMVLIFAGLAIAIALPAALASHDSRDSVLATTMVLAVVTVIAAGWPNFVDKTARPSPGNVREAQLYFDRHPSVTDHSTLVVIYDGCDRRDRFLTHALTTLGEEFAPSRLREMTVYMNSGGSPPRGLAQLSRDPGVSRLAVITARPCARDDLAQLAQLRNVTVVGAGNPSR